MENKKFEIASAQTKIEWVGRKVTGAHSGTIEVKGGELILNDGKIVTGGFVVDTTSIKVLDIADPQTNAQFAGHLASDDFFASEKFPEASFEITAVKGNHIEGNLTIKDIIHPIGFDADIKIEGELLTAKATLVVDRTKYDMKYRSGNFFTNLGDTLIFNDFELNVSVTAKAPKKVLSILS